MNFPSFVAGHTLASPTIVRRRLARFVARLTQLGPEELRTLSHTLADVHQLFRDATFLHGPLRRYSPRAEELLGLLREAHAAIVALATTTITPATGDPDPDVLSYAFQEACYALIHERVDPATEPIDRLYAAFEPIIARRDLDRPGGGVGT